MVQDGVETAYTYDALGQLVRVDDEQEDATWVYEYDMGGNILSKKKYVLGVTTGTPVESKSFTYGNPNWKDQLTAVNDVPITYDAIGNPLNDGEWTYTWQNGRQLARMQKDGVDASFVYNENGLRVQKTVNGVVTNYTLHGKNIVHMTQGSNSLHFFYDAQNKPAVVVYNGTPYSYVKNLQGDIVAILDATGNVVVSYVYDAWGRPIATTGSVADTLGTVQPFRYRGYVYDEEMGLYYLRSRYYVLSQCRFLNPDYDLMASRSIYCYGDNTQPNVTDPEGADAIWITSYWYLGFAAVPFGHTSLLLENEETGIWYYTMYAQNAVLMLEVPLNCIDNLDAFNDYFRGEKALGVFPVYWRDYTSATYIEGDFSASLSYFRSLRDEFRFVNRWSDAPTNAHYHLTTNNCVTMSFDLVEMGTTRDGTPMKTWIEDRCHELGIDYPDFYIPNYSPVPIARIFGNTSFTKPEE